MRWGQTNIREIDPQQYDIAWWRQHWKRTQTQGVIINAGGIVAYYPNDKYGPSCLLLGFTRTERPLHIQSSYPSRPLLKIVTLYEPDPKLWIDFRIRKA